MPTTAQFEREPQALQALPYISDGRPLPQNDQCLPPTVRYRQYGCRSVAMAENLERLCDRLRQWMLTTKVNLAEGIEIAKSVVLRSNVGFLTKSLENCANIGQHHIQIWAGYPPLLAFNISPGSRKKVYPRPSRRCNPRLFSRRLKRCGPV